MAHGIVSSKISAFHIYRGFLLGILSFSHRIERVARARTQKKYCESANHQRDDEVQVVGRGGGGLGRSGGCGRGSYALDGKACGGRHANGVGVARLGHLAPHARRERVSGHCLSNHRLRGRIRVFHEGELDVKIHRRSASELLRR